MSNVTRSGTGAAIDDKSNVYGGSVLAVLALLAIAYSFYHPGTAGFFGPILWPRLFSLLVLAAGVGMATGQLIIRNKQDFFGGVALIAVAVIGFLISIDLPGMRGFAFGPGTAPRLFAGVLASLGLLVSLTGIFTDGPEGQRYTLPGILICAASLGSWLLLAWVFGQFTTHYAQPLATVILIVAAFAGMNILDQTGLRGPFMITLSIFAFAMFIRPLGLVVASFMTVIVCASAAAELQIDKTRGTAVVLLPLITFPLFVYIWPFNGGILREITACVLSLAICVFVAPNARWRETVLLAAGLTTFCSILFPWGLNLPFQLWPRFW
jgi:hypothetical protein